MADRTLTVEDADRLLDTTVVFPDINAAFQRLQPITNFRKDDTEARILYICRRVALGDAVADSGVDQGSEGDLYILKCKVQAPSQLAGGLVDPIEGPSSHTLDELKALKIFADTDSPSLPHLISWKTAVQGADGPMPGGYIAYVVMTRMPGLDLLELKFWSMPEDLQEEIRKRFLVAIKHIWRLGFQPYDCALRNILWESDTRTLSIVDFEHYRPATKDPINMNEREEMTKWGILKQPLPQFHWQAWRQAEDLSGFPEKW
ncbi:hypothetical protein BDY17DRAFT_300073 [Neohortaea acidophila]|uniref:Protein kinase domain-containing protein n=1 Tax=Neohortaea acidophila TaxID=245834 RepID=A0A6A6PPG5_9PEZI|nr:uncharacterized protein BDY17DRAFT_300073 [Neohortaea acidophila]KAF2482000.1 hypothetical protein BDY17DRAFT_300073 [Neohortaea acidophila]